MWSLFKKKRESKGSGVGEGIFEFSGDKLEPLVFSNGKTQADVVKEILNEIEKGVKIIFIKGVCGTGKSAIALNLARHFKKTAIIVPIKSLQEQYEQDYTNNKFILRKDNKRLKIAVIKGRNNFRCPFLGERADDELLPCTIELKEKNMKDILQFIELNKDVSKFDFSSVADVRRMSVAPACPYWSPLLPAEMSIKSLDKANKKKYMSISGKEYAIYQRKKGCGYYDQYDAYLDADVLIFNSQKYLLEGIMGRKPKTDIDIIDECDEFLDNFASERKINLNRLVMALSNIVPDTKEKKDDIKEMIMLVNSVLFDVKQEGIEKVNGTKIEEMIEKIAKKPYLAEDDEDNYYNKVYEIAKEFEYFLEETYSSFSKDNSFFGEKIPRQSESSGNVYLNLVTINLAKRFDELKNLSESLVLMSGTLHSEKVLRDIFGLKDFKIIDAETINPGTITKHRMGFERNCRFENFKTGNVTRKHYLKSLNACVENAKKPILVHVNSFEDLPNELERAEFKLDYLISKERLKDIQDKDRNNKEVDKFKRGEIDVLFTTKCSRGVDFPGDKCNSIILTKYPYPNIQSLFWQILRKEKPEQFKEFYLDKSKRELMQKIYRGVRFRDDNVILLSPDSRVLDAELK